MKILASTTLFLCLFQFVHLETGYTDTFWCNPANTGLEDGLTKATGYNTLWESLDAMQGGDTLYIAEGDWTAVPQMTIEHRHFPPSGSAGAYTVIRAENDWSVRLPYISDAGVGRGYVEIRGIVFDSRNYPDRGHVVVDWHHTNFIRCGFLAGKLTGNNHTCGFGSGDSTRQTNRYNLMEECIAWGGGRYVFYSKFGQYNIFRRCVARHDNHEGGDQNGGQIFNFRAYACDYTLYQNCISIDTDRLQYYNQGVLSGEAGGFWVGDQYGATGNQIIGCISLNDVQIGYYLCGSSGNGTNTISNSICLGIPVPGADTLGAAFLKSNTSVIGTHLLAMDAPYAGQDGYYGKNGGTMEVYDSIAKNINNYGLFSATNSNMNYYNVGDGQWGPDSVSFDPEQNGLLYPVRIESGSSLATAGRGGGICGPTILKKIGVAGTIHGEPGYNTVTEDNLWPFPNEDRIKALMRETVDGVSGTYGFCAGTSLDGGDQTLTKYIWEYLGNAIPCEIYGTCATPVITTTTLPDASVGNYYSQTITATGGAAPYTWDLSVGALPDGLSFSQVEDDAEISGIPTTDGTVTFTVRVTDSGAATDAQELTITVNASDIEDDCGNGICDSGEDNGSCPQDCPSGDSGSGDANNGGTNESGGSDGSSGCFINTACCAVSNSANTP